jgi:hypothetical protein
MQEQQQAGLLDEDGDYSDGDGGQLTLRMRRRQPKTAAAAEMQTAQ